MSRMANSTPIEHNCGARQGAFSASSGATVRGERIEDRVLGGSMSEGAQRLPIRLVPRKGQQIGMLIFFAVFFGFSVFWMAAAAGVLDLNNGTISWPRPGDWIGNLFPLFGLPFAFVGLSGMAAALMKMRPNSPNFHLQLHGQGLLIKYLFKLRQHDWSALPRFETIRVERRTKNGKRISHYTVATETMPADGPRGSTHQREVVRILADEYGARNGKDDADALTAWLNHLRDLARDRQLDENAMVEVPEGFRATAISVAEGPAPLAGRSAPVIQAGNRTQRRPTVDRG